MVGAVVAVAAVESGSERKVGGCVFQPVRLCVHASHVVAQLCFRLRRNVLFCPCRSVFALEPLGL